MIIQSAGQYDSQFFSSLPEKVENIEKYYNSLEGVQARLNEEFPTLKIVFLPTVVPKTAYIQGLLLPSYIIKSLYLLPEQYCDFGLPIYAEISEYYQFKGIKIFDACKRINWEEIPLNKRHCIPLEANNEFDERRRYICSHNQVYITSQNCIFGVLHSAYNLFREYQKFEVTGRFDLKCLPHTFSDKNTKGKSYE